MTAAPPAFGTWHPISTAPDRDDFLACEGFGAEADVFIAP